MHWQYQNLLDKMHMCVPYWRCLRLANLTKGIRPAGRKVANRKNNGISGISSFIFVPREKLKLVRVIARAD